MREWRVGALPEKNLVIFFTETFFRIPVKTKIETTTAIRRFNFLVGHFDGLTGGKYDRLHPEAIAGYFEARGQMHYATELRELMKVIYGN